ncbi:hypothetical protein EDB81DRAFT_49386 [Dactylonectria macrodidyma]|uniref:Myb-like domain-containing protein n=1 Tax=Dactylonectria macrodidyma TaxID=307937 RepID=A0A9P9FUX6_9HYPO|nr:hypothetical protein EDB81DRAFT_49386 [Dactylonectria macrodidyma]
MTFTKDQAQTLIEEMCAACGEVPALESENHQRNIRRHDQWYKSILDNIFKTLSRCSDDNLDSSPFHESAFRWLCANANVCSQQAILDILLHPHVRSYRNRAALGSGDWCDLFRALETFSLADQTSQVPSVIGTYALWGRRHDRRTLNHDMVYIGQAGNLSGTTNIGIKRRAGDHWNHLLRRKTLRHQIHQDTKRNPNDLWIYRRISHDDIEEVSLALLTVLPYPRYFIRNASFHIAFLFTLAETIDVIYLGSIAPGNTDSAQRWSRGYVYKLRPRSMPHSPFEGLNRALPLKQPTLQFGSITTRRFWTPTEGLTLIDVFARHQHQIYCDSVPGNKWDLVVKLLDQQGISKSRKQVQSLYQQLSQDRTSGLITFTINMWQQYWSGLVELKEFLQSKDLVVEPKDENDVFYHIPEFEQKEAYRCHRISKFLSKEGFDTSTRARFGMLVDRNLPHILHKEVWEKITSGVPPAMRLYRRTQFRSRNPYLWKRTQTIIMYHLQRRVGQWHTSAAVSSSSWPSLCWIWYQTRAQLYAEGVPPDRIPLGGPLEILKLWRAAIHVDSAHSVESLPSWTYDPLQDAEAPCHTSNKRKMAAVVPEYPDFGSYDLDGHASDMEREVVTEIQEVGPEDDHDWPSDLPKYQALMLSWLGCEAIGRQKDMPDVDTTDSLIFGKKSLLPPLVMGNLHVSSLRVLVCIMRDFHQRTFDESTESDFLDLTDDEFWQSLFIGGLDNSWGIKDVERLQSRFGWVLDLIRKGQLPAEASLIEVIFKEVFADSVLKSTQHPYTYDVGCDETKYLNPDLSPQWVESLLRSTNALPALKACLERHEVDIGCDWIFSTYGLLIPHVWEEHMFEHDYGEALFDPHSESYRPCSILSSHSRTSSFDGDIAQPSVASAHQHTSSPDSHLTSETPHRIQQALSSNRDLAQHVDEMIKPTVIHALEPGEASSSSRKRSAAKQAPPVSKWARACSVSRIKPSTAKLTAKADASMYETEHETDAEDDIDYKPVEETEYETQDTSEAEALDGTNARSVNSKAVAERKKSLAFSRKEVDFLRSLVSKGSSWASIRTDMNERFGKSRTLQSIQSKVRRMDLTRPNARLNWTKEEDKLLTDAYQQHQNRSSRLATLRNASALDRTETAIEGRAYILGLDRNGNKKQSAPVQGSRPWTEEEDSLLTNVHRQYEGWADRMSEFNKKSEQSNRKCNERESRRAWLRV